MGNYFSDNNTKKNLDHIIVYNGNINNAPDLIFWKNKQSITIEKNKIFEKNIYEYLKMYIKCNTEFLALSMIKSMLNSIELMEKENYFEKRNPKYFYIIFNNNYLLCSIENDNNDNNIVLIINPQKLDN